MIMLNVASSKAGLPMSIGLNGATRKADDNLTGLITAGGALFKSFLGEEPDPNDTKFKRPKQNKLNAWVNAQDGFISYLRSVGEARPKMPGWRFVEPSQAEDLITHFNAEVHKLEPWRDDFLNNYENMAGILKDAYRFNGEDFPKVERRLNRWKPNLERMVPTLTVLDCEAELGLVRPAVVKQAIVKSHMEAKLEIVEEFEGELMEYLEGLLTIKRARTQHEHLEKFLKRFGPMVRTYSTHPDQVERLNTIEKELRKLPTDQDGFRDFDSIKEKATLALSVFEDKDDAPVQPQPLKVLPDDFF